MLAHVDFCFRFKIFTMILPTHNRVFHFPVRLSVITPYACFSSQMKDVLCCYYYHGYLDLILNNINCWNLIKNLTLKNICRLSDYV